MGRPIIVEILVQVLGNMNVSFDDKAHLISLSRGYSHMEHST